MTKLVRRREVMAAKRKTCGFAFVGLVPGFSTMKVDSPVPMCQQRSGR